MSSGMQPGDKDWADVILQMRRAAVDRFNTRRNLEWRLAFTLWAGLGLAANVLTDVEQLNRWEKTILILSGLVVVGFHAWWQWAYVATRAKSDRDEGIKFDELLRSKLKGDIPTLEFKPYHGLIAHLPPVVVTALLVTFAIWIALT